ncbi:MAG: hypothetical protein AMS14_09135 [Planctomycetes bacterium DG_20]|nr:MAG: hypothetical protein AMS14_09135 [Planctomycetes bacterium DG_20]
MAGVGQGAFGRPRYTLATLTLDLRQPGLMRPGATSAAAAALRAAWLAQPAAAKPIAPPAVTAVRNSLRLGFSPMARSSLSRKTCSLLGGQRLAGVSHLKPTLSRPAPDFDTTRKGVSQRAADPALRGRGILEALNPVRTRGEFGHVDTSEDLFGT